MGMKCKSGKFSGILINYAIKTTTNIMTINSLLFRVAVLEVSQFNRTV